MSRPSSAAAPKGRIDAAELEKRLGLASRHLASRFLFALGAGPDGTMDEAALIERVRALSAADADAKLRFAFAVHDEDGDGRIDARELERMLHLAVAENRLVLGDDAVSSLVRAFFVRADQNRDGSISFEEFAGSIQYLPGVLEHMTLGDLGALGLKPGAGLPPPEDESPRRIFEPAIADRAVRTYGVEMLLMAGYLAINLFLFVHAWSVYAARGAPILVQLARGCGACLNFHGALVLLPMLRRTLTVLGRTAVGRALVDDHVAFHRLVGNGAFYFAVAHTVAHVLNMASGPVGLVAGLTTWAGWTGVVLLLVHGALWAFARTSVRQKGRFEIFYLSHRLYPLWIVFLLVHGPVAWIWMSIPVIAFLIDRFLGRRIKHTRVRELKALPSAVTLVRMERPADFEYQPGDYVFVRLPSLARLEWHPFTLSSAPEQGRELTLHVRSAGDWTRALRAMAERGAHAGEPIEIDGPYGTATSHVFEKRVVVLVAAGIGVTPFASVLRSLMWRASVVAEHVHFVWVCREQQAFSWFAELLAEVEADPRCEVQVFLDAAKKDAKSSILRVAMDALYADTRADLVTGLRSRTELGAPDWDRVLSRLVELHSPEPVHCFFCGPPGLADKVREACLRRGVVFRQEHF